MPCGIDDLNGSIISPLFQHEVFAVKTVLQMPFYTAFSSELQLAVHVVANKHSLHKEMQQ